MKRHLRIAIDLMGSDHEPSLLFSGALHVARELPNWVTLLLLVEKQAIPPNQANIRNSSGASIEMVFTEESIQMEDNPLLAVRRKKSSSLVQGIHLLSKKDVHAFVSAGNTGALLAAALLELPLLPHIERPALLAILPTMQKDLVVLDVGANLSIKPQHFVQFAKMGAAYQQLLDPNRKARIGLLNVGKESGKGTLNHKKAYLQLKNHFEGHPQAIFVGNVEGSCVFKGNVDVIVTDGLSGNIFLKTSEGVSSFILSSIQHSFKEVQGFGKTLEQLQDKLSYAQYYGAVLAGVDGLIIKVHGYSTKDAFANGIRGAFTLIQKQLIHHLKSHL